jgi:phosphoribosylformylglycinamidine cyclo-ligase
MDYRSAGVDIEAGEDAKERYRRLVESTRTAGAVGAFGSFGGLFRAPTGQSPVQMASARRSRSRSSQAAMTQSGTAS